MDRDGREYLKRKRGTTDADERPALTAAEPEPTVPKPWEEGR